MNASNWIELVLGLPAVFGGGGICISKLTRIAVAVEVLAEKMAKTGEQVEDHEKRLNKANL